MAVRYLKGSISVSEKDDLPILRAAHRAGHAQPRQIFEYLYPSRWLGNRWESFRWRLRRLVEHEFLDKQRITGLGDVLSLGPNGELTLQRTEPIIVERNSRSRTANGRHQQWHDCDLFGIQLALRRAGVVHLWEHEVEVRATNDFTTARYVKDYDAVVTFRSERGTATVALEYERAGKSTREYARISDELNREFRVSLFLYLAHSPQLQTFLLHGLRKTRRTVLVANADEFCGDPRTALLIDAQTGVARTFDCLFEQRPLVQSPFDFPLPNG